jgi:hypothetical protein
MFGLPHNRCSREPVLNELFRQVSLREPGLSRHPDIILFKGFSVSENDVDGRDGAGRGFVEHLAQIALGDLCRDGLDTRIND